MMIYSFTQTRLSVRKLYFNGDPALFTVISMKPTNNYGTSYAKQVILGIWIMLLSFYKE